MKLQMLSVSLLCLVGLAACDRGAVTNVERDPAGGVDVTAQISEADISAAIVEALAVDNPLLRDPSVDLQAGKIVINGTHDQRDGSGSVSGTMTVTLSVENGAILTQVTEINIEGIRPSDERISNINQRISERVTRRADRENRQITFKSVTVSDTAVDVVFNVQRS